MSIFKKLLISILAMILLILVGISIPLFFIIKDACVSTLVESIPYPNKNYKIVVFERSCGATTDFSNQISILNNSDSLNNYSGNIFIADTDHGKAELTDKNVIQTHIQWRDNRTINIKYDSLSRIFKKEKYYRGFKIIYE